MVIIGGGPAGFAVARSFSQADQISVVIICNNDFVEWQPACGWFLCHYEDYPKYAMRYDCPEFVESLPNGVKIVCGTYITSGQSYYTQIFLFYHKVFLKPNLFFFL